MTKDDFVAKASEVVEVHFPKGKTKMRGEAMVLVAVLCQYLIAEGVISDSD